MTFTIRNLTGEPFRLVDDTGTVIEVIEPEAALEPATWTRRLGVLTIAGGVDAPIGAATVGSPMIPPPEPGVLLLVTEAVARLRPDEEDVVYPGAPVTDDAGNVLGHRELWRADPGAGFLAEDEIRARVDVALSGLEATTVVRWMGTSEGRRITVTLAAEPPFPLADIADTIKSRLAKSYTVTVKHGDEEAGA